MTSWLQVVWHKQEESLINLHCGREYHVYVVLFNAFGASPASQVTDFMLLIKAHSHDVRLTYAFVADSCVVQKIEKFLFLYRNSLLQPHASNTVHLNDPLHKRFENATDVLMGF